MFGGYENPYHLSYQLPAVNFGGDANVVHLLPVPKLRGRGLAGRILSIFILRVTEDFTGDVSDAGVRVGDGSDDDRYFDTGLTRLTETVDIGEVLEIEHDEAGGGEDIERGRSSVTVTCIAGATTETGIADVQLLTAWW
jgi:hypothetical protein